MKSLIPSQIFSYMIGCFFHDQAILHCPIIEVLGIMKPFTKLQNKHRNESLFYNMQKFSMIQNENNSLLFM